MENIVSLKKYACDYNVLVVEDSKHINQKLIEYLEKFFPEIDNAYDGFEGLEKYNNKRHDIVISDINMSRLDGNGFIEKLIQINPDAQVIIVSAFGHDENQLAFSKFGIVDFIQKPIDNLKLVDALLECIENKKVLLEDSNISYSLNEEIYKKLLERKNSNQTIELINFYKGVTFVQEGYIKELNEKTITIETSDSQYHLIKCEKRTIISIDGTSTRANLQYVDKNKQQLVLKKFEKMDRSPKNRKLQRVIPDTNFTLTRYHKGETLDYEVLSISAKSISVKTSSLDDSFRDISQVELVLGFNVSYSKRYKASYDEKILKPIKIRSKAYVFRIDKLADNSLKIVFVLDLKDESKKLFDNYIMQRETDILYELQSLI